MENGKAAQKRLDDDSSSDDLSDNSSSTSVHSAAHVAGNDSSDEEDSELRIQVNDQTVLLRDHIAKQKKVTSPNYHPIEVAVSHLTCTVKAAPPQKTQTTVATQLNCLAQAKAKKEPIDILHDVNCFLRPGQMTLLLGAPGCGKSTLLKLLYGNQKAGKRSGTILFNGKDPHDGNYHRSVNFVPQQDTHVAQLTVKETLRFSADCQMGDWLPSKEKQMRVDSILQVLGLSHRANTVVGDALLRGVSGGEKKRVTIGVEAVKDASVFLLDEPTTGLDSSASYDVLRAVRLLADMEATVLASLLQPSYEVFSLFDNVLILSHGEVAFFGARQEAMEHFNSLGYSCSQNTNPAEFLQEVAESGAGIVANPLKYRADAEYDEEKGAENDDFHWLTPAEFVDAYKQSKYYARTISELEKMTGGSSSSGLSGSDAAEHNEKQYARSSAKQFLLLSKRAFTKEWRDMTTNRSRVFSAILISLISGTLFLRLGNHQDDARTKLGLVFTIMAYFSFSALNALPGIIADRAVYYYQRDGKYYKPLPYLLSNILAEIPMTVIETLLFCSITYWMTGLNSGGDRFIYFLLICGAYYFMTRAFNRFIACIAPDLNAAQGISPVFTALSVLFGGYMITRTQIPGWWIWAYWMNPAIYGFQGLVSNEFWGSTYWCSPDELSPPPDRTPNFNLPYPQGYAGNQMCGITSGTDYAVNEFDVWNYSWIKWVFLAVICCYWLIWTVLAFLALRFVRHTPPPPPRMQEKKESDDAELADFDIQEVKKEAAQKRMSKKGHKSKRNPPVDKGAYLSWSNLNYSVFVRKGIKKNELQLLHDVSGYVKPGMMLALMGSSGAGKSTLMDVLARRKTGGKTTGDILINGRKADSSLNRIIGYVEQQDIHNPSQTVLEALEFSAICRLPHTIPVEQKKQYARSLLSILGLERQADMVIGNNMQDGISADQRKRVTMGVEMAADPAILFLDEPTSGLDSFGAERVMKAVQNISSRGTPVVCTIHQPSATIFGLFTHLLLLKKGGYTTYFGPIGERPGDCSIMLDYFSSALGRQLKPFQNPAEFILEVTGAGISGTQKKKDENGEDIVPKTGEDDVAVAAFRDSSFNKETQEALEKGIYPMNEETNERSGKMRRKWKQMKAKMQGRYATPFYVQLWELIKRSFLQYWRTPPDFMAKITSPLIMGLIMGTLFLQLDDDQVGATERAAVIYFSLIICNLTSMQLLARVVVDRAVFYRENASRTYNSMAYAITMIVVEYPFCLIAAILYVVPVYFIVGFQYDAGKFWIFFAVMLLNFLISVALVQLLALLAPNMILANSFCAIAFTVFALFSGFLISRDNIPDWWIWMHYLDINMYPLELLVANEMDGLNLHCSGSQYLQVPISGTDNTLPYCPMTQGSDFLDSVDFDKDNMLRDGLVFIGFYLAFIVGVMMTIKFVRHQNR